MKTRFLILLLLTTSITSLTFAQGLHAGIKGGANLLKVDGKSFSEEFRFGYNIGAFAEIYFGKKVGIQPEVLFNQINTRTTTEFRDIYHVSFSDFRDVKLNYLSIPVLLNYRPSKLLTFQAGPQFGILLNQDKTLLESGREAFKKGDLSLLGGVQLNIGGIKLGGRYAVGLNNINDIDNQDKWKNQGWQLYVGFRII